MKKNQKNNKNEPIGKLRFIKDFLPSPKELAKFDQKIKITIELDEQTVLFFKKEANLYNTKYQKMMREVLNYYAKQFVA